MLRQLLRDAVGTSAIGGGFEAAERAAEIGHHEGLIRALTARGFRIGVLKHDAHRLELDKKGKDTWRFRQAGAWRAVIAGAPVTES